MSIISQSITRLASITSSGQTPHRMRERKIIIARVFLDNTRNVGPDNLHDRQIFFSNIQNSASRNIFVSFGNKEAWWKVAHPRRVDDLQPLSDNVAITPRRLQVHCTSLGIVLLQLETVSPLFLLCRRRAKMNKLLPAGSSLFDDCVSLGGLVHRFRRNRAKGYSVCIYTPATLIHPRVFH